MRMTRAGCWGSRARQLARRQQGRTEQGGQLLFDLGHCWHWDLRAVTKLSMGAGLRVLMSHGGPPLSVFPHDSATDSLELKLRPVVQTAPCRYPTGMRDFLLSFVTSVRYKDIRMVCPMPIPSSARLIGTRGVAMTFEENPSITRLPCSNGVDA